MQKSTWERLDELFNKFPVMKAEPVSPSELRALCDHQGWVFHPDYSAFVVSYGGALVGAYPIFGLRQAEAMGEPWSVIAATMQFRGDGWAGTENWYIISMDGAGNPIGMLTDGSERVFSYDHDGGQIYEVANSFENFIRACLKIPNIN